MRENLFWNGLTMAVLSSFAAFVMYGVYVGSANGHSACPPGTGGTCSQFLTGIGMGALGVVCAGAVFLIGIAMMVYARVLGRRTREPRERNEAPRPVRVVTRTKMWTVLAALALAALGGVATPVLSKEVNAATQIYNEQCYVGPPIPPQCPALWDAIGNLDGALLASLVVFALGIAMAAFTFLPERPQQPIPRWR